MDGYSMELKHGLILITSLQRITHNYVVKDMIWIGQDKAKEQYRAI